MVTSQAPKKLKYRYISIIKAVHTTFLKSECEDFVWGTEKKKKKKKPWKSCFTDVVSIHFHCMEKAALTFCYNNSLVLVEIKSLQYNFQSLYSHLLNLNQIYKSFYSKQALTKHMIHMLWFTLHSLTELALCRCVCCVFSFWSDEIPFWLEC